MDKKNSVIFLIGIFLSLLSLPCATADNSSAESSDVSDQSAFPFDKPCLSYDQANFQVGGALLDIMTAGDFPQYCTLYALSNYQVQQKRDEGYFLMGSKAGHLLGDATQVFLKTKKGYPPNQPLAGKMADASKPVGQWAYFVGSERFVMENGDEKEYYVFQEIDF